MKSTVIALITFLTLSFGMSSISETKAQIFMFYDPFELSETEEEPKEEEEAIEAVIAENTYTENSTSILWVAAIIWIIIGGLAWRYFRTRKIKQKRLYMERYEHRNTSKSVAIIGLLLLFALPTQAQVYMDEETKESAMLSNMPNVPQHKIKYNDRDMLAPLEGEVLVLGLLGGAYLIKKKRNNKE